MKLKVWFLCFVILCLVLFFSITSYAAGKPDVTRHDANYLENAVNVHVEWQSPNPVTLVKISMSGVEKEMNIDPYDNKRNRDGYSGEVNVFLNIGWVSGQPLTYVIQLQDELRIKSPPVTGQIKTSSSQQSVMFPQTQQPTMIPQSQQTGIFPQTQQPGMQIQIQQNISQPQNQRGAQTSGQQAGSIVVIIGPLNASDSGAMWRVDNGQWKKSGEIISNLTAGIHNVEFQAIGNWIKPDNQNVVIEGGQTVTINGIYNK
jgi:hypothetical protein